MMKKIFHWKHSQEISRIIDSMRQNDVNLGTSDTVLGLFAQISQETFDRLNRIKGRTDKPYIILVKSLQQAQIYSPTFQAETIYDFASKCWPGPITLIVKAYEDLPNHIKSPDGTIALRSPAHAGLLKVLDQFDGIFSTSANRAGKPVPKSLEEIDPHILESVKYIIVDDEKHISATASTIVDCTGPNIVVVRQGAYPIETLEKICGYPLSLK